MSRIPVVFSATRSFLPYVAVEIHSILASAAPGTTYEFIILHREWTAEDGDRIRSMLQGCPDASVRLIDLKARLQGYSFYVSNRPSLTEESYYRLLIPFILPEYDRVIYLDSDMIVLKDLRELYETDLQGKTVAAARDVSSFIEKTKWKMGTYREKQLGLTDPYNYFISATLLMDTARIRREYTEKQILDLALSRKWLMHDQDVLNYLFKDQVLYLDVRWNSLMLLESTDQCPEPYRTEWISAHSDPFIIHYADKKPWTYFDCDRSVWFWRYATETPFFEDILRSMKENFPLNVAEARRWTVRGCVTCLRCMFRLMGDWWQRRIANRVCRILKRDN